MSGARFELEEVLGVTLRIWFRNLIPFLLLAALVNAPLIAGVVLVERDGLTSIGIFDQRDFQSLVFAITIVSGVLMPAVAGAVIYGAVMQRQGQPAGPWACIKVGLRRFVPSLAVSLLAGLLTVIGYCALIFPGVILQLQWWVAVPVTVVERSGVWASMRRSRELTMGRKKELFFLLVVLAACNPAVTWLVERVIHQPLRATVVVEILWMSFGSALTAVCYVLLREAKDGTTAAQLAAVFE